MGARATDEGRNVGGGRQGLQVLYTLYTQLLLSDASTAD
jgi:hypothetical protein